MDAEPNDILKAAYPGQEHRYFSPMKIGGGDPAVADEGAHAILSGIKTTTSSPTWDYPDGHIPFSGALSVLIDGQDRPRAILETYRVETAPFGSVGEDFARDYGEGERTLGWFRQVIGDWYAASAARHGHTFSDDTPIICEWFRVVKRL